MRLTLMTIGSRGDVQPFECEAARQPRVRDDVELGPGTAAHEPLDAIGAVKDVACRKRDHTSRPSVER